MSATRLRASHEPNQLASAWQLPSFTHFVYILHKIMDYTLTKIVQLFTITPFVIHFIFAKGSKT